MAFFRKVQQPVNKKWYPRSVLVDKPISTDQIAEQLSELSTVSKADVKAVLAGLSETLARNMAQGRSVRLEGIGFFYYTAVSEGKGADTPEEVTASNIKGVRVRFRPEFSYKPGGENGRIAVRTLTNAKINWVDIDTLVTKD